MITTRGQMGISYHGYVIHGYIPSTSYPAETSVFSELDIISE